MGASDGTNKDNFFSVVMPVYNVEKYLSTAIESVLTQTFENFELILVDDCSSDLSFNICDKYGEKDNRIRVIHLEKNAGVSNARNVGMKLARGRYLFFMDSDDYVDKELFESVYVSLKKNDADIVFFGMTEEHFDEKGKFLESVVFKLPTRYFTNRTSLRRYMIELEKATLYGYACNKFYRLSYLREMNLYYKEYALNEDILFNVAYCMDISRMNVLSLPAYHYRKSMNNGSRTTQFVKNYFELHEKRIQVLLEQYQYWGMCTENVKADLAAIYTRYIMSALQRNCNPRAEMNYKARRQWMMQLYDQDVFNAVMPYGHPKSKIVKILYMCLNRQWTSLSLVLGRLIYIVKKYLPKLFNIVQKNR